MGNKVGKLTSCFIGDIRCRRRNVAAVPLPDPPDEGHGHSFCYLRHNKTEDAPPAAPPPFGTISGASISANASTSADSNSPDKASAFESSDFFSSIPLQPIPAFQSAPIPNTQGTGSGPIERGFQSGPIERSFISAPLENPSHRQQKHIPHKSKKWGLPEKFKFWGFSKELNSTENEHIMTTVSNGINSTITSHSLSSDLSQIGESDDVWNDSFGSQNLQWAHGKAGEDRVHVVISEEHGWMFVGIYDGFNGPDATDFLLHNLYYNVYKELKGLLWCEGGESLDKKVDVSQSLDGRERAEMSDMELDRDAGNTVNHLAVLKALSEALRKTEASYLEITDLMLVENPELALMGSCVLAMVMKGDDVYLMNVGDSRAVLAQKARCAELAYACKYENVHPLSVCQLTMDHSTSVREEVIRIRNAHADDPCAILNNRVKGSLKVTRAFGAGYLKNPKWNDAVLKVFRVDYIGSSPYIMCSPSVCHHKLDPTDKFLILSSDGLYQYFTNDEAAAEVETFMLAFPEADPAQHLVEEILFRAAKRAGMDFHELLDIPQGDRRKYHDDVSIIIISFEGRIWRSSM